MFYEPKYTVLDFDGTIGEFIKTRRKAKKINSIELSKSIGKSDSYISHLENNRYKKLDYDTLYEVFRAIGIKEETIEDLLYYFGVFSPRITALQKEFDEMEEARVEREIKNMEDPDYQEHLNQMQLESWKQQMEEQYDREIEWITEKEDEINKKNTDINNELKFFIDKRFETFMNVIDNLHSLVMSMSKNESDYELFTSLFKRDISKFSDESKKAIIECIKEEYEKTEMQSGWWGKPPSF